MADKNVTKLKLPQQDPFNIEAVKRYVFNETGNIMMASTDEKSDTIQQSVRDVFAEVSVFFAAMTKAISQTRNPYGTKDSKGEYPFYNLYNYDALEAVIDGSGFFVHVNEEDVSYSTKSWGADFSKELIEAIIGLAIGAGAFKFASAMLGSMGKAGVSISGQSSSLTSKVANVMFVCEYLLGMPVVSAIVVTADSKTVSQTVSVGPCFKEQSKKTTMTVHKDTYMFVPPAFIKQYAGDLNSGMNDPQYLELIMHLEGLVERKPQVDGVFDITDPDNPTRITDGKLTAGAVKKYAIFGQYLGTQVTDKSAVNINPVNPALTFAISTWNSSGITFQMAYTDTDPISAPIMITLGDGVTQISAGTFDISVAP
jgi:hypothetical protein